MVGKNTLSDHQRSGERSGSDQISPEHLQKETEVWWSTWNHMILGEVPQVITIILRNVYSSGHSKSHLSSTPPTCWLWTTIYAISCQRYGNLSACVRLFVWLTVAAHNYSPLREPGLLTTGHWMFFQRNNWTTQFQETHVSYRSLWLSHTIKWLYSRHHFQNPVGAVSSEICPDSWDSCGLLPLRHLQYKTGWCSLGNQDGKTAIDRYIIDC